MTEIEVHNEINLLRPALIGLTEAWQEIVTQSLGKVFPGLKLTKITETWRSKERQLECYKTGASKFTDSFHCYGMAFDFACYEDNGVLITRGEHEYYRKCGLVAQSLGLLWGGSWIRQDWDHIQIAGMTLQQVKNGVKNGLVSA